MSVSRRRERRRMMVVRDLEQNVCEKILAAGGDPKSGAWNVKALRDIWDLYGEDKVDEAIEKAMERNDATG
jgi:hypothetical protein